MTHTLISQLPIKGMSGILQALSISVNTRINSPMKLTLWWEETISEVNHSYNHPSNREYHRMLIWTAEVDSMFSIPTRTSITLTILTNPTITTASTPPVKTKETAIMHRSISPVTRRILWASRITSCRVHLWTSWEGKSLLLLQIIRAIHRRECFNNNSPRKSMVG